VIGDGERVQTFRSVEGELCDLVGASLLVHSAVAGEEPQEMAENSLVFWTFVARPAPKRHGGGLLI
jgi:hypothetical protein